MEPKKLKKLVLKKDVVSKLENAEMNHMRGGTWTTILSPQRTGEGTYVVSAVVCSQDFFDSCVCFPSGEAKESCVPIQCYGGGDPWAPFSQSNCYGC